MANEDGYGVLNGGGMDLVGLVGSMLGVGWDDGGLEPNTIFGTRNRYTTAVLRRVDNGDVMWIGQMGGVTGQCVIQTSCGRICAQNEIGGFGSWCQWEECDSLLTLNRMWED